MIIGGIRRSVEAETTAVVVAGARDERFPQGAVHGEQWEGREEVRAWW